MEGSTIVQMVRPPTLMAAVVERMREAIIRGDLPLGSPLREVELGKSLDVSRGTVREALRELQDEGLVEVFPHRGAFVTQLPPQKVREIYTLRALLEPYAVRLAIEHQAITPSDLAAFEAMLAHLAEMERRGETYAVVRTDAQFHLTICGRSGHQLLMEVLRNLQSKTMLLMLRVHLYGSDSQSEVDLHRAVLDALRGGDPIQAEIVLRQHITESGERLVARLKTEEESAGSRMSL
jgi:DNA-binding GntR family transcriptional regulator